MSIPSDMPPPVVGIQENQQENRSGAGVTPATLRHPASQTQEQRSKETVYTIVFHPWNPSSVWYGHSAGPKAGVVPFKAGPGAAMKEPTTFNLELPFRGVLTD
jgi:hypothetical protein